MVDVYEESKSKSGANGAVDPEDHAEMPEEGYRRHPLFPREDDGPESRDIQFVSFRRRRTDGRADNCPEDIPAHQIHSWGQVTGPWGGGEYKAIAKDSNHRIVAWAPEKSGEWILLDGPSKPFTVRGESYTSPSMLGEPAAVSPAAAASSPARQPADPAMSEVLRELRELRASVASASTSTPAPASAPAPSTNDAAIVEMIKSQGELMRTVLGAALAPRPVEASAKPSADPVAMALQLISALRPDASAKPTADPVATAVQLLGAFQKFAPQTQGQGTVTDRLGEYRAIRELATPSAPPAPQSEFGEIKDIFMSVMQAEAMSKTTREVLAPPSAPERRPPPPPPPSRAPLQYVPGLGMVRVEQPEAPPLRADERALDYEALLRDPSQRQRMLQALGLDKPVMPAPAIVAAPPSHPPVSAPPSIPVAVESTPVVSVPAATPAPSTGLDSALGQSLHAERTPVAPTTLIGPVVAAPSVVAPPAEAPACAPPSIPVAVESTPVVGAAESAVEPLERLDSARSQHLPAEPAPIAPTTPIEIAPAPIVADERIPIVLPERMPVADPHVATGPERDRATTSLGSLLKLPQERLRSMLCALPGVEANVEDLMSAMQAIPQDAWPAFVSQLPADMVRALGDFEV